MRAEPVSRRVSMVRHDPGQAAMLARAGGRNGSAGPVQRVDHAKDHANGTKV
jgi:hypothetical protein